MKASLLMSLESTGSRCEQLARQIQVFGRIVPTEETVAKLNAVTLEDVQRARRPHLPRARRRWPRSGPAATCRRCRRSPTGWRRERTQDTAART